MRQYLFLLFFLGISYLAEAQPYGYTYGRTITIRNQRIAGSGSHTNFPVVLSVTSNNLRQVGTGSGANAGRLESANADDVVFYTSDCLTKLDHQIEYYDASSGTYIAWVKIPSLSTSANTIIHMYYGNASASNTSTSAVWDSNYRGVWHFGGNVNDATANGNNLTDNPSNLSTNNNTSQVGQGRQFDNNGDITSNLTTAEYLRLPNGFLSGVNNFTFEGWVNLDRYQTNWERIFDFGQGTNVNFFFTPSNGNGTPAETRSRITVGGGGNEQGPIVANTGTINDIWVHWAVVLDNAANTMSIYRNGVSFGTSGGVTLNPSNMESSTANYFGRSQYAADHYMDAYIDEFRISNSVRSADWIQTSFNNQFNPTSAGGTRFFNLGGESAASTLCTPLPITLSVFNAIQEGDNINLTWSTSTETNNNYFTIERSHDGRMFELVDTVRGAGNSSVKKDYTLIDANPFGGKSYYRLTQTDYDGTTKSFPLVAVELTRGEFSFNIYPNPTQGEFYLELLNVEDNKQVSVSVSDLQGKQIIAEIPIAPSMKVKSSIPVSSQKLLSGIYLVKIKHGEQVFVRKLVVE